MEENKPVSMITPSMKLLTGLWKENRAWRDVSLLFVFKFIVLRLWFIYEIGVGHYDSTIYTKHSAGCCCSGIHGNRCQRKDIALK